MTDNHISTEVPNESRELDAIVVDSKDPTYRSVSKEAQTIFNEDEENLEFKDVNGGGNALGDLTNRGGELNVRRELKGQKSRSALIFDEVEEIDATERKDTIRNTNDEVVDVAEVDKVLCMFCD